MKNNIQKAYERIREKFKTVSKLGNDFDIDSAMINVDSLLSAAQAEHNAEVGELVEALEKIATQAGKMAHADNLYSDPRFSSFWSLVSICEPLLRRYIKTTCHECGGKGKVSNPKRGVSGVSGRPFASDCPTCKGSGKVWRKKL